MKYAFPVCVYSLTKIKKKTHNHYFRYHHPLMQFSRNGLDFIACLSKIYGLGWLHAHSAENCKMNVYHNIKQNQLDEGFISSLI